MPRNFDAIVIGSGLGGLTAAALFAHAPATRFWCWSATLNFGGAATVYHHGALAIEASLHEIDGLDTSDPKGPILRTLGIDRDIPFVNVGALHEVRSPLFDQAFRDAARVRRRVWPRAKAHFPQQASGIEQYFERIDAIRQAVAHDERPSGRPRLVALERADLAMAAVATDPRPPRHAQRGIRPTVRQ